MSADTKETTVGAEVKQSDRKIDREVDSVVAGASCRCSKFREEEKGKGEKKLR